MAFTEAQLQAQLDPANTGRTITIESFIPGANGLTTDVFGIGVVAPYAGRSRWTQILNTQTAAQAAVDIQNKLRS
jgi:hypothetical protein